MNDPLAGIDLRMPWRMQDTGSAYVVSNADGRRVACFCYRREAAVRNEYPAPEEARAYAVAFARLSRVVRPAQQADPHRFSQIMMASPHHEYLMGRSLARSVKSDEERTYPHPQGHETLL